MTERDILNIQETVERARVEGLPLSQYTLRRAIRSGAIPCRRVGRTYLVFWPNVTRWVTCADGADNPPLPDTRAGGIRRQEVDAGI